MTTAQVFVAIVAVLAGQILPRVIFRVDKVVAVGPGSWWFGLLPPAWFAGFDDAFAGRRNGNSWVLAAAGLIATLTVLWLAFGKLAEAYGTGLQAFNEVSQARPKHGARRRWLHGLVNAPPLSLWLRDSVSRASFLLCAADLWRDRDVKLRIYPGLAPMLVMPVIFLVQDRAHGGTGSLGGFGLTFAGAFLGLTPMLGLSFLQYSQQWQAADLFRTAPVSGPAPLCDGARKAVLFFLTMPLLAALGLFACVAQKGVSGLLPLLPGIIAMPVFSFVPCLRGNAVPLSQPTEEAKSAARGVTMFGAMIVSFAVAGLASWAWSGGWFTWFLLVEAAVAAAIYIAMRASLANARWPSAD